MILSRNWTSIVESQQAGRAILKTRSLEGKRLKLILIKRSQLEACLLEVPPVFSKHKRLSQNKWQDTHPLKTSKLWRKLHKQDKLKQIKDSMWVTITTWMQSVRRLLDLRKASRLWLMTSLLRKSQINRGTTPLTSLVLIRNHSHKRST